ncbi:hypothetical protein [Yoonia algicola]|uniref:Uncharacterized protein n=1 Tax=Yoonia algicola TaxID=3137368 RepID=A0AAN0MBH5_9RHOB
MGEWQVRAHFSKCCMMLERQLSKSVVVHRPTRCVNFLVMFVVLSNCRTADHFLSPQKWLKDLLPGSDRAHTKGLPPNMRDKIAIVEGEFFWPRYDTPSKDRDRLTEVVVELFHAGKIKRQAEMSLDDSHIHPAFQQVLEGYFERGLFAQLEAHFTVPGGIVYGPMRANSCGGANLQKRVRRHGRSGCGETTLLGGRMISGIGSQSGRRGIVSPNILEVAMPLIATVTTI